MLAWSNTPTPVQLRTHLSVSVQNHFLHFYGVERAAVPVVQQDVGPPDLVVREPDVGHTWVVWHVPLQVEICPVLQTHANIIAKIDIYCTIITTNAHTPTLWAHHSSSVYQLLMKQSLLTLCGFYKAVRDRDRGVCCLRHQARVEVSGSVLVTFQSLSVLMVRGCDGWRSHTFLSVLFTSCHWAEMFLPEESADRKNCPQKSETRAWRSCLRENTCVTKHLRKSILILIVWLWFHSVSKLKLMWHKDA